VAHTGTCTHADSTILRAQHSHSTRPSTCAAHTHPLPTSAAPAAALSPSPPPNAAAFSLLGDDDNEAESPVLGSRRQQQPAAPTSLAPPAAGPAMTELISLDTSPVQAQPGGIGAHDRSMSDQLDLTDFQDEIGGQQKKQQ
jgi:hypothetical protein